MGNFNSPSPKPHIMYSNDRQLIVALCERAGYMRKSDIAKCPIRTSKTYIDKKGIKRSVGCKKAMRESQFLVYGNSEYLFFVSWKTYCAHNEWNAWSLEGFIIAWIHLMCVNGQRPLQALYQWIRTVHRGVGEITFRISCALDRLFVSLMKWKVGNNFFDKTQTYVQYSQITPIRKPLNILGPIAWAT